MGADADIAGIRVSRTAYRLHMRFVQGSGALLGRIQGASIEETTDSDLFENAEITAARASDVDQYLRARTSGAAVLDIGELQAGDGTARARLRASGFDRHTFLCGQSGSGKTYALGAMLERILLETELRLVIIDPNSDYVHLGEVRSFEDAVRGFGPELSQEGYATLRDRYLAATRGLRVFRPAPRGESRPDALRIRFSDLAPLVQGLVLRIDPLKDRDEYHALRTTIRQLNRERYSLSDMLAGATADLSEESHRLARRISNLGVANWDIWAEADEPSVAEAIDPNRSDWRAVVLDVGGFTTAAEKSLVATGTFGMFWARRESRKPVLIVVDEAHNMCAQEPTDPLQAEATERAIRIAGEGRKYGLYLLMSTQRPQKIHENVLSQCDNLVLMRMNSTADVAQLAEAFSFVPASLLERANAFVQGESLVAGKIAPSPLLLRFGGRISREGGSDVPTTWASAAAGANGGG
jgi:DNA helicase HerA-like ATPase